MFSEWFMHLILSWAVDKRFGQTWFFHQVMFHSESKIFDVIFHNCQMSIIFMEEFFYMFKQINMMSFFIFSCFSVWNAPIGDRLFFLLCTSYICQATRLPPSYLSV